MGLAQMWFGTEGRMRWIPAPMAGGDSSPGAWGASGTLLGGGGYAFGSFGSHKNYQYGWGKSGSRQAAQLMKSYYEGTFGRGLIYFIDPLTYDTNVLPAHWADPSLTVGSEAPPLIRTRNIGVHGVATVSPEVNDLPAMSAVYSLTNAAVGYPGAADSLFIPVPPGKTVALGAIYSATGSGGVYAAPVSTVGGAGTPIRLTTVSTTASIIAPDTLTPGSLGIRIWVGKSATGAATATLTALTVRFTDGTFSGGVGYGGGTYGGGVYGGGAVIPDGVYGPWIGGQGHSGCRFAGPPTYITHSGTFGGQIEYAASFKEVGSWMAPNTYGLTGDTLKDVI